MITGMDQPPIENVPPGEPAAATGRANDAPLPSAGAGAGDAHHFKRDKPLIHRTREHRRRRLRRHGRRAYVRSVYFLPSLCTLGNAICGFAAIYISTLDPNSHDDLTNFFYQHRYMAAAYMIFVAMLFDGLDGRLARFTRHTTDFGGQLDSMADMVSFGVAPAMIALQLFKDTHPDVPNMVSRLIWAIGALYMSCAAMRLARFNVSNEHGEQHHRSFLGLPSPGAGGAVVALILMQQDLAEEARVLQVKWLASTAGIMSDALVIALPLVVLVTGILMVSNIRYPHMVNRYLKGRKSIATVVMMVIGILLVIVAHRYILGLGCLAYAMWGPGWWLWSRAKARGGRSAATAAK